MALTDTDLNKIRGIVKDEVKDEVSGLEERLKHWINSLDAKSDRNHSLLVDITTLIERELRGDIKVLSEHVESIDTKLNGAYNNQVHPRP